MAYMQPSTTLDKARSIGGVIIIHIIFAYAAFSGMAVDMTRHINNSLNVINLSPPPAPKEVAPVPPKPAAAKEEEESGAASEKNLRNKAAQVAAPERRLEPPAKNKTQTAQKPGEGSAANTGASDEAGSGTGAGGAGDGTGSGNSGEGTGSGIVSRAVKTAGTIKREDARGQRMSGSVAVYFRVMPDGRVTNCRVRESSGNPELDRITCNLIEERFRYEPARNARGEAVSDITGWRQDWWLTRGGKKIRD